MICPLCEAAMRGPSAYMEDVWDGVTCECEDFEVNYWGRELTEEIVYLYQMMGLRSFKVVFDRAKNETAIYEIFVKHHDRDEQVWTEHIISVPPIKEIPKADELIRKVKIWITFS